MINLPVEFADSEPPDCTPPAAVASIVGGPSMVAGLGGAPRLGLRQMFASPSGAWRTVHRRDCKPRFSFGSIAGYHSGYWA